MDRFKFRAFYQGRFIYKSLTDANYYDKNNKCIGLANTLPNNLKWEQCTGLRDKNGKLIYENDYVTHKGNIYKVFWNKTKISLEDILNNDIIDIQEFDCMEVIGNEHEKGNIRKI